MVHGICWSYSFLVLLKLFGSFQDPMEVRDLRLSASDVIRTAYVRSPLTNNVAYDTLKREVCFMFLVL
jgi:hypothetical protein